MDPLDWQKHIRTNKHAMRWLTWMKDPSDELKLVIVRDMWLTGFDVPSLHTMYIDKPMKGHGLMQTIARVNRVFKDKQGGLIVDYLGIAPELKDALAYYADNDRKKSPYLKKKRYGSCSKNMRSASQGCITALTIKRSSWFSFRANSIDKFSNDLFWD